MTIIFGQPWDAPVCDGAGVFPEVPTYAACLICGEQIGENDQGYIMPMPLLAGGEKLDPKYLVGAGEGYALIAQHRECQLIQTVGHMVGVCSCTGWDTGSRASEQNSQPCGPRKPGLGVPSSRSACTQPPHSGQVSGMISF